MYWGWGNPTIKYYSNSTNANFFFYNNLSLRNAFFFFFWRNWQRVSSTWQTEHWGTLSYRCSSSGSCTASFCEALGSFPKAGSGLAPCHSVLSDKFLTQPYTKSPPVWSLSFSTDPGHRRHESKSNWLTTNLICYHFTQRQKFSKIHSNFQNPIKTNTTIWTGNNNNRTETSLSL